MLKELSYLKNKTVLLAEDDELIHSQMKVILEMLFHKVFCAYNGLNAYDLYLKHKPDLILSDIKMPELDGFGLIDQIRKEDYETPIILTTSFDEKEFLYNAANLSIDGYLLKPINLKSLLQTIKKAMQRGNKNQGLIDLGNDTYFNTGTQELFQNGKAVVLGLKEIELINLLASKGADKTVSKEDISYALWPLEDICKSSIKMLVLRLRKKLGQDFIISVRGVGYRLNGGNNTE